MRERAIRFGGGRTLVGILTEGVKSDERSRPGVIFLNSGILHHVGACRLHVRLARRLAESGFTSLRFDHSGIGDSEARRDSLTFEQSAVLEVREAMDYLQRSKGIDEFIVLGLCSGADMGFRVSQEDPRIVGLVQLDAYAYRTPLYYWHYYAPRVASLQVWRNFLRRKLQGARPAGGAAQAPSEDYVRPEYRRRFPPREEVERGLRTLLEREVEMLFLFSGGQPDHYNHRAQYRSCFRSVDFGDRLQVEYFGDADHLFSGLRHQETVDAIVHDWAVRVHEGRPGAARVEEAAHASAPAHDQGGRAPAAVPRPAASIG